ncbi:formate dehydrogenase subunit delta [Phaeovulum sp.]|jgi:formate dehydrogenase subunit delta|uniref:formate dehydrogenase subunit delta n=1 Tax=Phaeovulum sp. TaxID=2934796 RepID=UPI002731A309|nr:formate dehydrogenase subunit delta [Phaeovulum sp.]MDP1669284.1 formate dehydrogenase subunit delta [Phaeovulum sp.]MDP2063503.1 formate dehydrogenase subunit delta [Phaeovulum sp.]MDZ4119560.1 formate dehydrogenase subunit delta [Phaeovulum sp.]
MRDEKLIRMANQIAAFFVSQPGTASEGVAAHINDNWSPPMRAALLAHVAGGGAGLALAVVEAAPRLRPPPARAAKA